MRDYPWHLRLPTAEHFQWFKNLVDLHELTTGWLKEVQMDRPSHLLTRGLSKKVYDNLWMLDSLSEKSLENYLDDTHPSDVLGRLEYTVWAVQNWTLSYLETHSPADTRNALESLLEQASWKLGRATAEKRWKEQSIKNNLDLKSLFLALHDSPFSHYPKSDGFLVRRAIQTELQIELRECPHQNSYSESGPIADRLCHLHSHWMRGFAYALNSRVSLEAFIQKPRCLQRWTLV